MPRGQKKGWKEKQGLVPGARVPGHENRGILYTAGGRFSVYYNYANRRQYAGTFGDLVTAREARDQAIADRRSGRGAVSLKAARTLFSTFVDEQFFKDAYLTSKRGKAKKDSTIRAAKSRYSVYLKPFFGQLMLEDVTYGKIREFRRKLDAGTFRGPEVVEIVPEGGGAPRRYKPRRTAELSAKSRREILILLRQIVDAARRERIITEDPFPEGIIPAADRPDIEPPDFKTALAIAEAIPSLPHRVLTLVLVFTGCRLGESLALRWEDVDFREKRLHIGRSADAKTRKIQEPKTKRGVRSVPLDARLAKELRAYRTAQKRGQAPSYDAWLFPSTQPNAETGQFVLDQRSYVQRHFDPARRRVTKNRVTPHMLRHTWCSVAVTRYPVAYVSKWAGHSDVSFTYRVYVQPFEAEERRLAASFALGH
jgi:integrase